jgi:hypothetical protein
MVKLTSLLVPISRFSIASSWQDLSSRDCRYNDILVRFPSPAQGFIFPGGVTHQPTFPRK